MNPERTFARQAPTLVTKAKLFQVHHEPIPSMSSFVIIKKLTLETKKTKHTYAISNFFYHCLQKCTGEEFVVKKILI